MSMTTNKDEPEFLRNLTGRAVLPEDVKVLEKWEKIFKESAENYHWPFPIIVDPKEKK